LETVRPDIIAAQYQGGGVKLEKTLRRRLRSQETLLEAVSAMKSLSAHHFRLSRAALLAAREYRSGIEAIVNAVQFPEPLMTGRSALLLIGTDRGLCGGYTSQVSDFALAEHQREHFRSVYCIGRRQVHLLEQSGMKVSRVYSAPSSVAGIMRVLLAVAQEILAHYLEDEFSALDVVSARFDGVGAFTPVSIRVLPVVPHGPRPSIRASEYVSTRHLMGVTLREYLYTILFEILVDALASEHSARLAATQSAEEWLNDRATATRRSLASIRREVTTQEILDIVAGARSGRRSLTSAIAPGKWKI
jgi:F-type H+-transporting ATPase subunit gamma